MPLHYRHLLAPSVPSRRNRLTALLGGLALKILRWRITGTLPDIPQAVVVAAPHTSNYDGVIALPAMRWLGLIPVERHAAGGAVGAVIEQFTHQPQLWLGVAPEGTRHGTAQWKTGFHRIALGAGVPIFPVAWDYTDKCIILGEPFMPSVDLDADLERLYAFFRHKQPCRRQRLSTPLHIKTD